MPIVQIELLPRPVEDKRILAKEITDLLVRQIKCPPEAVRIIFREMKEEDYAAAGVLRCDKNKPIPNNQDNIRVGR